MSSVSHICLSIYAALLYSVWVSLCLVVDEEGEGVMIAVYFCINLIQIKLIEKLPAENRLKSKIIVSIQTFHLYEFKATHSKMKTK